MKNILLLHPKMLFYKVRIYNKLALFLERHGYKLYVWPTVLNNIDEKVTFTVITEKMTPSCFNVVVKKYDIKIVINILFGIKSFLFTFYVIIYGKFNSLKLIYYGHGVDLTKVDNILKIFIQNILLCFYNYILLYSKNEKKYLWKCNKKKVFVANNTLVLDGYDRMLGVDPEFLKKKYGINQSSLVLFCGRVQQRKRLDILLDIFETKMMEDKDIGLLIVGPGLPSEDLSRIDSSSNMYYLGAIYDEYEMSNIFYMSKIFCIPGHIGLGLVEAMYWGKPVVTMQLRHAPEIAYLDNGANGFMVKTKNEIANSIVRLLEDQVLYDKFSSIARNTYLEKASLEKMFQGFVDVIKSCC